MQTSSSGFPEAWCQKIFADSNVNSAHMDSLQYSGPTGPNENSFFAKTIATPSTVRACVPLYRTLQDRKHAEALLLLSLGTDLSSHSSLLAGALSSVFMDETMGLAAAQAFPRSDTETFFTVSLNLTYVKPVPTPGKALCRGEIVRIEGRKLWAKGTIEDGQGKIYVKSSAVFVKARMSSL